MFDLDAIKNLTDITSFEWHSQLDSTNDRAIELVKRQLLSYPALILAEKQTAGRGQRQRRWWSGEGSLTFSWVIVSENGPTESRNSLSLLPATVALAVAEAIERSTNLSNIQLKWPNDLIVASRKLSGILIETVAAKSKLAFVVGIGVNVNNADIPQHSMEASGDRRVPPSTSVLIETRQTTSLNDLLIAIIRSLEIEFDCLKCQPNMILERYNQRLFQRNEPIRVAQPGGTETCGVCQGISSDGGLILKTINGTEVVFSGTIQAV